MSVFPSVRYFLRCRHPATPENSYQDSRGHSHCITCRQAKARQRYEAEKLSRVWTRGRVIVPSRAFCARCVESECIGHGWDGPDHRCFRPVNKDGDLCSCGSAWGIRWLRDWMVAGEAYVRVGRPEAR